MRQKKTTYCIILTTLFSLMFFPLQAGEKLDAIYEQGIKALGSGNYGSAELLFRKLVDADRDEYRERGNYYFALAIFYQGKFKSAIFNFNKFLLMCNSPELCIMARFWVAESYFKMEEYITAIQEFKKFISLSKNDAQIILALERIGDIYFIQRRYDEAIIEWEKASNRSNDGQKNTLLLLKIGEANFYNENYDKALQILESIYNTQKDIKFTSQARLIAGRIYQIKNRHRQALWAFALVPDILLRDEPFYDLFYFKALSHIALGARAQAKSLLESFIAVGAKSEWIHDARYELGKIYIAEGNEKAGMAMLEEVRNRTAKMELRSKSALVLGKLLLGKNPGEAIPYLEDSVSLNDPGEQRNALLLLARVYLDAGRYDDSQRILELLIDKYPFDRDIDEMHFLRSQVYLEKGDFTRAMAGFNKIRENNPFSKYVNESIFLLARAHFSNGRTQKALELVRQYLSFRRTENTYEAYVLLLGIYQSLDDYKNARGVVRTIMQSYSEKKGADELIFSFGMSAIDQGHDGDSYLSFIVRRYPATDYARRVYLLWGDRAFEKKEYKNSERYYSRYLGLKSGQPESSVYVYWIISLYKLGRYESIIAEMKNRDLRSFDAYSAGQLRLWLARSYYRTGQYARSFELFYPEKLTELSPGDRLFAAISSVETGAWTNAEIAIKSLQDDKEMYARALFYRGEHYMKRNNIEKAKVDFLSILFECPESDYADNARLAMAGILLNNQRYEDAARSLGEIDNEKLAMQKNALLIIAHLKSGKEDEAMALLKKNRDAFLKSPQGEDFFRSVVVHFAERLDYKNLGEYGRYLHHYPNTDSLLNYLHGQVLFKTDKLSQAYYYLYKLSQNSTGPYFHEALYYLGLISLYHHKNSDRAIQYFTRGARGEGLFAGLSRINLSILLKENGKVIESRKYLKEIIQKPHNAFQLTQAKNLYEYYGYTE